MEELFKNIYSQFKRVDILINCAGISNIGKIYSTKKNQILTEEMMNFIYKINILGTFLMISNYVHFYKQN